MKTGYVIPTSEKVAYGVGDLAINIAFGSISFYMLWFIVNIGGISPAWAGIIFLVARVWDAFFDYVVGRLSDNTKHPLGRSRPYIIYGAIPLGLSFIAIWYAPPFEEIGRFFYFLVTYLIFNTVLAIVAIPYGSLMAQMTQNYDERTELSTYRVGLSFVGTLIAAAGIVLMTDVMFKSYSKADAFGYVGIIFGIIIMLLLILTGIVSKERVNGERTNYEGFFTTIHSFLKLKEFRNTYGLFLFNNVGVGIIMALFIFFLSDVLKVEGDATLFMAIPLVSAIVCAPFWNQMSNRYGKRLAYIIGSIFLSLVMLLVLLLPEKNVLYTTIVCILAGIGISACQIIPMSIIPDIIDIDEHKNGIRREGALNGILQLMQKVATGLSIAGVSLIIEFYGYVKADETAGAAQAIVQPETALTAIRILLAVAPAVCFVISILCAWKLNVSKDRFNNIIRELESRKKNGIEL
ncbi:MFS transporter [Cohnella sp. WQ 127256]|uniref:MFS transporter n=1 Tax=Cohnella sp. WQ 127256 TaxID=2938790 RepID=UPI0021191325|nr:glycoside-pentoside-hexuronide (GPH):cation symporter [Cohnella sp. WQ 127256]